MIGKLTGKAHEHRKDAVIIETTGGVGYIVSVHPTTKKTLLSQGEVSLHTHTLFRKDSIELFGFLTTEEQSAFLLLLSVSGIGPKKAFTILEKAQPHHLFTAIQTEDAEALVSFGVNRKDAQKIVIDLRKKIEVSAEENTVRGDVIVALSALGYSKKEIQDALKKVNAQDTLEQQIQGALRSL